MLRDPHFKGEGSQKGGDSKEWKEIQKDEREEGRWKGRTVKAGAP
jgi:hypothetical protein